MKAGNHPQFVDAMYLTYTAWWAHRFGEGLKYTAQCTILQAPSQAKGSIALKVDVAAERQLTESDQDDIRSQVVVSVNDC